jgi:hypothetical protein
MFKAGKSRKRLILLLFNYAVKYRDYIASMIGWLMNMEQFMEWELAGETEVLWENQPQYHSAYHKSHMIWPDLTSNPHHRGGRPTTNCLSYGTSSWLTIIKVLVMRFHHKH